MSGFEVNSLGMIHTGEKPGCQRPVAGCQTPVAGRPTKGLGCQALLVGSQAPKTPGVKYLNREKTWSVD